MSTWKLILLFIGICCMVAWTVIHDLIVSQRQQGAAKRGKAAWYGEGYRGKTMANGQPFDPDALTCATFAYPLGTKLLVEYQPHDAGVIVTVTDRGPDPRLNRLIDLSRAAFTRLESLAVGVIEVEVTEIVPEKPKGASDEPVPVL